MSSLSPESLQWVGGFVVANFIAIVTIIWKVAVWKAKNDFDMAQFGERLGFAKGKEQARKLRIKRGCPKPEDLA